MSESSLQVELTGSSEFSGYTADLKLQRDHFEGTATRNGCGGISTWQLRVSDGALVGNFEHFGCNRPDKKRKVGLVISSPK
jgi:hypothetical protein